MTKSSILEIEVPYVERERKYAPAPGARLEEVLEHVKASKDVFVTANDARFLPNMDPALVARIQVPNEVTGLRQRIYFADSALTCFHAGIEIRQEMRHKHSFDHPIFKQVIKIGANKVTAARPTLERTEYPAKLSSFGANLKAVGDKNILKKLSTELNEAALRPVIQLLSQRTKLVYHPEGDPDVAVELAFDLFCHGATFDGYTWEGPQLEIELKKGATNRRDADAILAREEKRFMETFGLRRDLSSKPAPGLRYLMDQMGDGKKLAAVDTLKPADMWWQQAKPATARP